MAKPDLTNVEYRSLPCELTDTEKLHYGHLAATGIRELGNLDIERKSSAASFKARIELKKTEVADLTRKLETGMEDRSVACRVQRDYAAGVARIYRCDNDELISVRPLTPEEQQAGLDLFGGASRRQEGEEPVTADAAPDIVYTEPIGDVAFDHEKVEAAL